MAPSLETPVDGGTSKPIIAQAADGSIADLPLESKETHDHVLGVFRAYIADLCEQFKGGHPGSAMGMAAIGVALYKYVLRYSPKNCDYFNRDRFVLSNGPLTTHPGSRIRLYCCPTLPPPSSSPSPP